MTGVRLVPGMLDERVPALMTGHNVVALVPAAGFPVWSAMNAWRVARSAAAAGRRTALVDCVVDEPVLHTVAGAHNDEGLVDAFEYGASLNRIAQQQPEANLYFIPAGTFAPEPKPVLTNPRWRRLSAGFRHEEALLLLFVPENRLESLSAELDGMMVLAPQGMDLAVTEAPGVVQAMSRGLPLLAVIGDAQGTEADAPEAVAIEIPEGGADDAGTAGALAADDPGTAGALAADDPGTAGALAADAAPPTPRPALRRRASAPMALLIPGPRQPPWALYVVLFLGAVGAGSWLYRDEWQRLAGLTPPPPAPRFVHRAPPPHPVDSLRFAVQVAALPSLVQALDRADSIEARGTAAFVTPIRLGRQTWFRVHVGPVATRPAADSLLGALRAIGLATASAVVVAAPLSLALAGGLLRDSATAARDRLREAGLPVFILGQADRRFRLYAGAFETPAQAAFLLEILTSTGGTGELVPRVGYLP